MKIFVTDEHFEYPKGTYKVTAGTKRIQIRDSVTSTVIAVEEIVSLTHRKITVYEEGDR